MAISRCFGKESVVRALKNACAQISETAEDVVGNVDKCGYISVNIRISGDSLPSYTIEKEHYVFTKEEI